jgi:hypothetical protein
MIYENNEEARKDLALGKGWPSRALTMIGLKRLDNIRFLVEDVIARGVPGDLIEAGAWRGGATIYMRAVLKAHDVEDRVVWVADSFEGLPSPKIEQYPMDGRASVRDLHKQNELAVSLEVVKRNFERYGLLDDQVKFLKGWFSDTLPTAPIEKLAVLRIDGDMYESTMDALTSLYPKLSPGGYVVLDDVVFIAPPRQAVNDYREKHGISAPIELVDWNAAYWKKEE